MRRARVPPFKGNLPNELISQQSSFSWCGAQSTAAEKPEHGKPHAADLPFVRLGRRVSRRAQLRELLPLHPRSSPPQPPNLGTARCGTPAGLAQHGWDPACGVGMARHRDTRRAELAEHSTAQRGTSMQAGMAQHRTGQRSTSVRDWHGTARSRAASRAALLTPLPTGPTQSHSWPPLGLSSSSQRRDRPPPGYQQLSTHTPTPHPPFTKTYVTPSLIAQRCANTLINTLSSSQAMCIFLSIPTGGPGTPHPFLFIMHPLLHVHRSPPAANRVTCPLCSPTEGAHPFLPLHTYTWSVCLATSAGRLNPPAPKGDKVTCPSSPSTHS